MERERENLVSVALPGVVAAAVREAGESNVPAGLLVLMGVWSQSVRADVPSEKIWAGLVLVICGGKPVAKVARDESIAIRRVTLGRAVRDFREACKAVGLDAIAVTVSGEEVASDE